MTSDRARRPSLVLQPARRRPSSTAASTPRLEIDGDHLIAADFHGDVHRFRLGRGAGRAARLVQVVPRVSEAWWFIAVVDEHDRPLVAAPGQPWDFEEARAFGEVSGLGWDLLHVDSVDRWLREAGAVRIDDASLPWVVIVPAVIVHLGLVVLTIAGVLPWWAGLVVVPLATYVFAALAARWRDRRRGRRLTSAAGRRPSRS
ncbi:MAG: hypothetical protein ACRD29_06475 [Acidimicrobiales bacterium]